MPSECGLERGSSFNFSKAVFISWLQLKLFFFLLDLHEGIAFFPPAPLLSGLPLSFHDIHFYSFPLILSPLLIPHKAEGQTKKHKKDENMQRHTRPACAFTRTTARSLAGAHSNLTTNTQTHARSKRHHPKPLNQYSWQGKALFNTFDIPPLLQDKFMSLSS